MGDQERTESPHSQWATDLLTARHTGERLTNLVDENIVLSLEDGFAIQQAVGLLGKKKIAGWKCALPKPGKWIVAPLYSDTVIQTDHYQLPSTITKVRIEPELACALGKDLPPRAVPYTVEEIAQAIGSVLLSLEVLDCRFNDPAAVSFEQILADGLFNHGVVLGPPAESIGSLNVPKDLKIEISQAGGESLALTGTHPDENPLLPIVWLANFLSQRGIGLYRGQIVITGSYAGVLEVPFGEHVTVKFGNAGSLSIMFSNVKE